MVKENVLVAGFADDVNAVAEGMDPVTTQLSVQSIDQISLAG